MGHIAMVTGASSGVGREFVRQLATGAGGPLDEIWAIARNQQALEELSRTFDVVRPIPLDLTRAESFTQLESILEGEGHKVQWLVNCAGLGRFGSFGEVGLSWNARMIQVNCLALVQMCSIALAHMAPGSRIVNLASIAGPVPQPELTVYSATKAFVLELSRMLDHELSPIGIHVTAVCPKFMRTGFLDAPGDHATANRMTVIGFEDVHRVVSCAIARALLGRQLCITSPDMRASYLLAKILPRRVLFWVEDLMFRR